MPKNLHVHNKKKKLFLEKRGGGRMSTKQHTIGLCRRIIAFTLAFALAIILTTIQLPKTRTTSLECAPRHYRR